MTTPSIFTFVICSASELDKKESLLQAFSDKEEFSLNFIEPILDESNTNGLWKTIQYIAANAIASNLDYFVICKDSHRFTANYNKSDFLNCIVQTQKIGGDLLCGDARSLASTMRVSKNIFWIDNFPE